MSLKVRLARFGAKKKPYYRIVVADERFPRNGRFVEQVGTYDPKIDPVVITLKEKMLDHWLSKGAQPTRIVGQLIKKYRSKLQA